MNKKRFALIGVSAIALAVVVAAAAFATVGTKHYAAGLAPIRHSPQADGHSSVTGTATLDVTGTQAHVVLHLRGLSPNLPHAMHIHGLLAAKNECPTPSADTNGDGLISLEEGAPFTGRSTRHSRRPVIHRPRAVWPWSGSRSRMRTARSTTTEPSRSPRT